MLSRWLVFLLLTTTAATAQPFYFSHYPPVAVSNGSQTLTNPFAGGFNSAQFGKIKLNNDNVEDLVIFDRTSRKLLTFLAVPQGNTYYWQYSPKYESRFPADLNNWVQFIDYDRDGKKDIFTSTNAGFRVFHNTTTPAGVRFDLAKSLVYSIGFSGVINLAVPVTDIASFTDFDEDGDIDVLTYDVQGSFVEYHKNQSQEMYGIPDSLVYKKVNICWGKYQEGGSCEQFSFGVDCPPLNEGRVQQPARTLHVGSTLLITDLNGDGRKDALIGDVSCNYMFEMLNEGTVKSTVFNGFGYFPDKQTLFPVFPAAFLEDVDFDGNKDLLISPNTNTNEGRLINFRQSAWLYKNKATTQKPDFQYVQQDFLQNTMIDLGENAAPAFADLDADGDLDLLLGSAGTLLNNAFTARLTLYENTGTATQPAFTLKDADYLQLSARNFTELKPFFKDIDGNGTPDLGFTATLNNGQLTQVQYLPNTAPAGQAFRFNAALQSLPLPLSNGDVPYLYDVDGDGNLDALVGKTGGGLQLYKMTGGSATAPLYTLDNATLFGISDQTSNFFPAVTVADFDKNNQPDLLFADNSGRLRVYANFLQNLGGNPTPTTNLLLDSLTSTFIETRLGGRLFPATADLNNDGFPDLAIGSQGGGLLLLLNHQTGTVPVPVPPDLADLYPNPVVTTAAFYLNLKEDSNILIFNVLGQKIAEYNATARSGFEVKVQDWANGLYLVKIQSAGGTKVKKVVLQR